MCVCVHTQCTHTHVQGFYACSLTSPRHVSSLSIYLWVYCLPIGMVKSHQNIPSENENDSKIESTASVFENTIPHYILSINLLYFTVPVSTTPVFKQVCVKQSQT